MKEIKGIITVTITPFKECGEIDYAGAAQNIDWLISQGVHGLCIMGATGEYLSVTTEEHKDYVKKMLAHVAGRVPVIVGATRERTDDVIDLMKHAKAHGADAAMVLPPYYCRPSQEEIFTHYQNINEGVDLPVLVYNNPHSAGVEIEYGTLVKIAQLPNMKLIKESTGDIKKLTAITMNLSDRITPLCGWENMCFESFAVGAQGWICVLSNFAPKLCIELYEAVAVNRDLAKGFEIYRKCLPTLNFLEGFPKSIQLVKYLLDQKGLTGGLCRKPRIRLTDDEKKMIDQAIDLSQLS